MKIKVTTEKLNTIRNMLSEKDLDGLSKEIPYLIAMVDSLLNLFEGLSSGLKIFDIRRMFGVIVGKVDKGHSKTDHNEDVAHGDKKSTEKKSEDPSKTASESQKGNVTEEIDLSNPENGTSQDNKKKIDPNKNSNHPGKCSVDDYSSAKICIHHHVNLKPGDECSQCLKGKLKFARPRRQILFEGAPFIQPVIHFSHDLICNLCETIFRVEPPESAKEEGLGSENRYGYSAISMIAIAKFFGDLPWYRSSRLHGMMGINLSPSTQFDQTEKLANVLKFIGDQERFIAAQVGSFALDDTGHHILSKEFEFKKCRTTGKTVLREGCHSSIVIAYRESGHPIVMIKTDIIHAGEWIDKILINRQTGLPKPLVSGDRHSSNKVTVTPVIEIGCNQHARQKFHDHRSNAPNLVQPILDKYREIFRNDAATIDMNAIERLTYHKNNSKPIMDKIVADAKKLLTDKIVAPNSDIGKDCQYILNHEVELRGFHLHEKAPLHNNLTERLVAYIVLLRKNIHFFKNETGAAVADTIFSVGLSAFLVGINVFQYFRLTMLHADDVRNNPENWLPWAFSERYPQHMIKYPDRKVRWPPGSKSAIIAPWLEDASIGVPSPIATNSSNTS